MKLQRPYILTNYPFVAILLIINKISKLCNDIELYLTLITLLAALSVDCEGD